MMIGAFSANGKQDVSHLITPKAILKLQHSPEEVMSNLI